MSLQIEPRLRAAADYAYIIWAGLWWCAVIFAAACTGVIVSDAKPPQTDQAATIQNRQSSPKQECGTPGPLFSGLLTIPSNLHCKN